MYSPSNAQLVNAAIGVTFRAPRGKKVSEHAGEGLSFIHIARDLAIHAARCRPTLRDIGPMIDVKLLVSRWSGAARREQMKEATSSPGRPSARAVALAYRRLEVRFHGRAGHLNPRSQ